MPLLWFGLYQAPRVTAADPIYDLETSAAIHPSQSHHYSVGPWSPSIAPDRYQQSFARIKDLIAWRDTYLVNYTFRLRAPFLGSPAAFFSPLSATQKDGFNAYIDTGRHVICSASPELFFQLDRDQLTSKPLKGTLRRSGEPLDDDTLAEILGSSKKDRA
jgi:para-aminobenzoate synthetase/4-amino-4-deoxychorismate lyase